MAEKLKDSFLFLKSRRLVIYWKMQVLGLKMLLFIKEKTECLNGLKYSQRKFKLEIMEQSIKEIGKFVESAENSKIRAEIWGDFVGWDNRRRGDNGFLVNQLSAHGVKNVLDLALGDGVDTIYLLQNGFEVSCNEYDGAFRAKAVENARKSGFGIRPTSLDWRDLKNVYPKNSQDAMVIFGNSLTCLFGRENQLAALEQFREILRLGGSY